MNLDQVSLGVYKKFFRPKMDTIIVPVHPPKIDSLINLVNSVHVHSADSLQNLKIVLICSNIDDLKYFQSVFRWHPIQRCLHYVDAENYALTVIKSRAVAARLKETAKDGIINVKKFIGLSWMANNEIDDAACIDSDVIAIASYSKMAGQLRKNHRSSLYIGSSVAFHEVGSFLQRVNKGACDIFGRRHSEELKYITDNYDIYTWFFDAPFYTLKDVNGMFRFMNELYGSQEAFFQKLSFDTFDHLVYIYYRALMKEAKIFNATAEMKIENLSELMSIDQIRRISEVTGYASTWINLRTGLRSIDDLPTMPSICMLMHTDRDDGC